jgi:uncharacterized protein YbcI
MTEEDHGSRGEAALAISNEIARLHREYYGRGAPSVRTYLNRNLVATVLDETHTPAERTLVRAGELEAVRQMRLAFQRAMKAPFVEIVERALDRKVRVFMSQVDVDEEIAVEIFLLED